MATNYKDRGTDLDDVLEPRGYFSSPSPDFIDYKINGTSMEGRFASYGGRGWEKAFSSTYLYQGTPIRACQKGYKPSVRTRFYTINGSAGQRQRNIYITRTDSALTFSGDVSVSFGPSSFRNGAVPKVIGIVCCGGGGGANFIDKDKNEADLYYGGGGGGVGSFLINLEGISGTPRLLLGQGGGRTENGSSTALYIGDTYTLSIGGGGYGLSGNFSGSGSKLIVHNSNDHIFSSNGEVLTTDNAVSKKGCKGREKNIGGGVTSYEDCQIAVTFDASDPSTNFGTYAGTINGKGLGGGSLNGSMVSTGSNGTNGGGAGCNASSGGAGAAYFFY